MTNPAANAQITIKKTEIPGKIPEKLAKAELAINLADRKLYSYDGSEVFEFERGGTGYTGSQGETGYVGSKGDTGYTGSKGDTGSQGEIGYTGSKGDTGSQGLTGYTGSIGYTGSQGATGNIGSTGYTGSKGDTGSLGYTGSSGSTGPIGYTGSKGTDGSSGAVGYTGSQGIIGYTGSKGSSGAIGYTGSKGDTGYAGSWGGTASSDVDMNGYNLTEANNIYASIYYDKDDASYYVDPNGTSLFHTASIDNILTMPSDASANTTASIYFHWSNSTANTNSYISSPEWGGGTLMCYGPDGNGGNSQPAWTYSSDSTFRVFTSSTERFRVESGGNAWLGNPLYVPTVYDGNDSNYYVDPNATSKLNALEMVANLTMEQSWISLTSNTTADSLCQFLWSNSSAYTEAWLGLPSGGGGKFIAYGPQNLSGNNVEIFEYDPSNNAFRFYSNGTERLEFNSSGTTITSGIFDTASNDIYASMRVIRNATGPTDGNLYIGFGNSNSGVTHIFGGGLTTGDFIKYSDYSYEPGSFHAPIFYDSDNTAYYVDPNGNASLYTVYADNWFRANGDTGLYFQTYSCGLYSVYSAGSGGDYGTVSTTGNGKGGYYGYSISGRIVFMHDNVNTWGIYNDVDNTWQIYGIKNSSIQMNYATYAPVYYDLDNSGYYFDGTNTGDSIRVAGNIVAYYSDERLKDIYENIPDALQKVNSLRGFYYTPNEKAQSYGYLNKKQVGLSAQEVQKVLPEIVTDAPIGDGYLTIDYERMVPLLVEAIKELTNEVNVLKEKLK